MTPYTNDDLLRGAGAFEQAMLVQAAVPDFSSRMTAGTAIGILASMMRSRLPASVISELIDTTFGASGPLLKQVLTLYEGGNLAVHLWTLLPSGQYRLCPDLRQRSQAGSQYERDVGESDL
ncbi:hypothetical protein [Sphingomonas desiccabilis]|nr:hypothetical protein [Sphingomonas desiccabilis]MBB3909751.1 ABC-type antimicrobial peptide transport system permease subunit [Sphingomonas desiccabilis]